MSKQIDLTSALSDEDRAYLEARGRLNDIARADAAAAGEEWTESTLTAAPPAFEPPFTGDVNPIPVEERDANFGKASQLQEDETEEREIGQTGGVEVDYTQFNKAQLKEELEKRNEGKDEEDQWDTTGTKAELVAALQADDAAEPDAEEGSEESQ